MAMMLIAHIPQETVHMVVMVTALIHLAIQLTVVMVEVATLLVTQRTVQIFLPGKVKFKNLMMCLNLLKN